MVGRTTSDPPVPSSKGKARTHIEGPPNDVLGALIVPADAHAHDVLAVFTAIASAMRLTIAVIGGVGA